MNSNHMTVRKYLLDYLKKGYVQKDNSGLYPVFKARLTPQFLNLKLYYNLERLRTSSLIDFLNAEFDYPQLVIFGSYAAAHDTSDSDIDICMITDIQKECDLSPYEKYLGRSIDLRKYCEREWKDLIKDNPELINNIAKGIVVSDEFEVIR
ncbi:MAG: nucleotidyltransferase domain-containing protein [Nanoarchaeota archaeon]